MDEVSYDFDNEQQFWDELDDLVSADCETHELIDNALRSYLNLTTSVKDQYLKTEYDVARCNYRLLSSDLFAKHRDYIRQQIIYGLLQDDAIDVLHFVASLLLFDGRENEKCFERMNSEGAFPRLLDLIMTVHGDEEAGLHRLLMELLYEMSRIQRIKLQDLVLVEDDFVRQLFEIIEELSDDINDPYHYPVIRVLLVLNEQFMVSAHDPNQSNPPSAPLTNKVMKILSSEGGKYKTFGENIILLLNRESETSLQLLTLKLMYLLFTTPSTQEYFYTNDLRVLVDILIRNLLDLPEEATALRHTYLRVLYPLLSHTQLRHPPHYKRAEIKNLLAVLVRGQAYTSEKEEDQGTTTDDKKSRMCYFEDVDETTIRLVSRCGRVSWLKDPDLLRTLAPPKLDTEACFASSKPSLKRQDSSPTSATTSTSSPIINTPPTPPLPRILHKRDSSKTSIGSIPLNAAAAKLGMEIDSARTSSLSVLEVAAQREKPGVITPSRKANGNPQALAKKEKPAPPKTRRSGWIGRKKAAAGSEEEAVEDSVAFAQLPGDATSVSTKEQEEQAEDQSPKEASALASSSRASTNLPPKKPPPAPKTRRWRLNRKPDSDAAIPPSQTASYPSPPSHASPDSHAHIPPLSSNPNLDSLPAPTTREKEKEKESVSSALGQAQAEAVKDVAARMEDVNLNRETASGKLAPPNVAPRRGVVGPRFEVLGKVRERERGRERSPFQDEDEDEDEDEEENESSGGSWSDGT